MKIEIIGFDLDGTLYEDTPEIHTRIRGEIYEKLSYNFGISLERARDLFEEKYSMLFSGSKTILEIATEYKKEVNGADFIQEALQEADFLDLIQPNSELLRMLGRLSKRRKLDLITGSEYDFALKKLDRLGINKDTFEHILTDEDGSKSSGEIYKKWLEIRNYLSPDNLLYVGDNEKQDIIIPKSLGIKTCFVGWGKENNEADFQINSILGLESILSFKS